MHNASCQNTGRPIAYAKLSNPDKYGLLNALMNGHGMTVVV